MLKIRRPLGRLIFNMGIAIPGTTVFLIETAPSLVILSDRYWSMVLEWRLIFTRCINSTFKDKPPSRLGIPLGHLVSFCIMALDGYRSVFITYTPFEINDNNIDFWWALEFQFSKTRSLIENHIIRREIALPLAGVTNLDTRQNSCNHLIIHNYLRYSKCIVN